ncbi:hypothetical protein GC176_25185 [bacterium]|nr:hypothetical protein [bacterium]
MSHGLHHQRRLPKFCQQLVAVSKTYTQRRMFVLMLVLSAIAFLPAFQIRNDLKVRHVPESPRLDITAARQNEHVTSPPSHPAIQMRTAFFSLGWPLFVLVPILAMHVRTQMIDPRSRMIPGFAAPHLTVAGLILTVFVGGFPIAATAGTELSTFGTLALVTFGATALFYAGHFQSALLSFGVIAGLLWLGFGASDSVSNWIEKKFLLESTSPPAVVLLTGSLVALAGLAIRMSRTHEQMPEYGATADVETFWNQRSTSAKRQQQRVQAQWVNRSKLAVFLCDRFSGWLMHHLPRRPLWRRLLQFEIAHGMMVVMLPMMLVVMFLALQIGAGLSTGPAGSPAVVTILTVTLPIMAVSMLNGQWMQHWNWFPSELMFPPGRRDFVRSLLMGILLDGAAALVICEAIIAVQVGRISDLRGMTPGDAWLLMAVLSGSNIVSGSALIALVLSYRDFWWTVCGVFFQAGVFGVITIFVMETAESGGAAVLMTASAIAAAGGCMAAAWLALAWRRWNEIEFG